MKKVLIIAAGALVFAATSCKKEQQVQPKNSSTNINAGKQAQTTYNYQQAIMAKHTISQ